ncbi:MAG: nucleotidyltransferase family protein [Candidatus Omnitrophica bacterium]|nr:nucleotidyltransferase family protein [Candidatus Omnitrophota bacterium]MCM8771102.1 nucleotidyltransferase family protein [Candidatus Omnitrophota bacterium]
MDGAFYQIAARNLLLLKHTKDILVALKQEDISVIVLKGIALIETVYPQIGMREIADIDLLVKTKDLSRVSQKLIDLGYIPERGTSRPTFLMNGKVCVIVQLHTDIPYLRENEIWTDLTTVKIDGEDACVLPLEETLIYLCYHAIVSHLNTEQKWLEDIHRFVTKYKVEIDWEIMAVKIKKYRLTALCYYSFTKVKEIFNSAIPDIFLSNIKPGNRLQSKIFQRIFNEEVSAYYFSYLLPPLIQPRLIFSYFFPMPRFLKFRYNVNSPLIYLYYFVRPVHLISKGIRALWNLFFII